MGDVVNLNKYRKKKAREAREKLSSQQRTRHGTTQAERALRERRRVLDEKRLDGHKLEGDE